jgi:hypothetical protein
MNLQVIGAGLGRTGTNSLKLALEQLLGGPCYHMFELFQRPEDVPAWQAAVDGDPVDWSGLLDGWVATVDWPGAPVFDQMAAAYPDALVLLSIRDGEAWYRSMNETIFALMRSEPDAEPNPLQHLVRSEFAKWLTLDIDDQAKTIAAFDRHNERVRDTIPAHRLVEWGTGDGWQPLCEALGLPIPDDPFPHANASGDFRSTVSAAQAGDVARAHTDTPKRS